MNEIRSVLVRMGRLARPGGAGSGHDEASPNAGHGEPLPNEGMREDERPDLPESIRSPAWLVLEILFVTILVFFWL